MRKIEIVKTKIKLTGALVFLLLIQVAFLNYYKENTTKTIVVSKKESNNTDNDKETKKYYIQPRLLKISKDEE